MIRTVIMAEVIVCIFLAGIAAADSPAKETAADESTAELPLVPPGANQNVTRREQRRSRTVDGDHSVRNALQEKCSISIRKEPLADVLATLARQWNIQLVIDRQELMQETEQLRKLVSVKVDNVSRKSVLKSLLKPDLGYVIQDDRALLITTKAKSALAQVTRTYTVADLAQDEQELEKLCARITDVVEHDSWQSRGGSGVVRTFTANRSLIIRQTDEVHEQVTSMLQDLREKEQRRHREQK